MKSIKNLIFCVFQSVIIAAVLSSCSFDDLVDRYEYTSVYFIYQDYNRNVIVGEGLKLNVGFTLMGLISNPEERIVHFEIDPSLLDEKDADGNPLFADKTLLPSNYYSLGHSSQVVIPKGELCGYLPVKMDSVKFLADPKSLTGEYVLPIRITKKVAGLDTIHATKSHMRIHLSYFARQFGNYQYSGEVDKYMEGVLYQSYFYNNDLKDNNSFRYLQTVGPTTFRMIADPRSSKDPANGVSFLIQIPTYGTEVTIEPDPDAPSNVSATGPCVYDPKERTFHLEYSWKEADGTICYVVFRS